MSYTCCNMCDDYKYMDVTDVQTGRIGSLEYRFVNRCCHDTAYDV